MNQYAIMTNTELIRIFSSKTEEQANRIMSGKKIKKDLHYNQIMDVLDELVNRGPSAIEELWNGIENINDNGKCYIANACIEIFRNRSIQLLKQLSETSEYPFVKTNAWAILMSKT